MRWVVHECFDDLMCEFSSAEVLVCGVLFVGLDIVIELDAAVNFYEQRAFSEHFVGLYALCVDIG